MVTVRRRDKESVSALVRRFTKKVQFSRVLATARDLQFRDRSRSKAKKRKDALHRVAKRNEMEHLEKLGKLPTKTRR